jgi:hypothetical protein
VKYKYEEYFQMLTDLWKDGWYAVHEDREQLDWLGPLNPAGERSPIGIATRQTPTMAAKPGPRIGRHSSMPATNQATCSLARARVVPGITLASSSL